MGTEFKQTSDAMGRGEILSSVRATIPSAQIPRGECTYLIHAIFIFEKSN